MPGWLTAALKSLQLILGLFTSWRAEVEHETAKAEGKAEQTADEAHKIEDARREREKLDREIAKRSDAELDADLDKWMRD